MLFKSQLYITKICTTRLTTTNTKISVTNQLVKLLLDTYYFDLHFIFHIHEIMLRIVVQNKLYVLAIVVMNTNDKVDSDV